MKDLYNVYENLLGLFQNNKIKENLTDVYFAGGYIRDHFHNMNNDLQISMKGGDVDIYFHSEAIAHSFFETFMENKNEILNEFKKNNISCEVINEGISRLIRIFTQDIEYQIIISFALNPKKLIETYEFTANMCYYVPSSNEYYIEDPESVNNKVLVFNLSTPRTTGEKLKWIVRGMKFQHKGWALCFESFLDLCCDISGESKNSLRKYYCEVFLSEIKSKGIIS